MSYLVIEMWIYNLRHDQHPAAQLNLIIRKGMNEAPGWVFQAGKSE